MKDRVYVIESGSYSCRDNNVGIAKLTEEQENELFRTHDTLESGFHFYIDLEEYYDEDEDTNGVFEEIEWISLPFTGTVKGYVCLMSE
jgi:hypothetical protein